MKGYGGQILFIDLNKGTFQKVGTHEYDVDRFVGGFMMNCRLAYDVISPEIDPLSPENAIIFGAGPIVGSSAPMSSKLGWISKNPMNGTISGGMAGGMFGPQMKWAGYDSIVITGRSKKPVFIKIMDEDIELCDATSIWGIDVYQVTDMLWKEYGGDSSVITTGKAGENLVFTSITLMDKVSTAGKGGLGAVFGSKNLKAIVVKGTKGIRVEDPEGLQKLTREFNGIITSDPRYPVVRDMGAYVGFDSWANLQGYSIRNWREKQDVPEVYRLYGPDIYKDRIKYQRVSDPFCPIACKDHVKLRVGPDEGLETFAASLYGRVNNWGARCQLGSYELVVKCQDFANRTGLCVHAITALIDWAVDLYKEGVITKEDTEGMELDWNFETTWNLINQAAEGKGFGKILGMGFLGAIDRIGRGSEKFAFQVKGIECLYDPRLNRLGTAEFGQVTNPRGAHPVFGATINYMTKDRPASEWLMWAKETGISQERLDQIFSKPDYFNVGRMTKYGEDWLILSNSLGVGCGRARILLGAEGAKAYADLFSAAREAVTGTKSNIRELRLLGERGTNLYKILNVRAGFSRKNDKFPNRWFEPVLVEGKEVMLQDYFKNSLTLKDCEMLLDDYYDERGWNVKKGIPKKDTLEKLGLSDMAGNLESNGFI